MKNLILILIAVLLSLGGNAVAQTKKSSLQDYVGRYGNKEVTVQDGVLHYQRIGGRGATLRATGQDTFALNEDATVTFTRDAKGTVVEMAIDWVAHDDEKLKREALKGQSSVRTVDATTLAQLETIMTHLLRTIYVSPEKGEELARKLKAKFDTGSYANANLAELTERLTSDLREWGNDRHLYLRYNSELSPAEKILDLAAWEKQRGEMFARGNPARGPALSPQMAERLQRENYHFRDGKMLDGKVGYVAIDGFAPGAAAQAKAAEVMSALAGSEALILDLRECPGGGVEMINFLASYFFPPEPRVLMNRYIRPTDENIQSKTLAEIPGKRMTEADLYLLTSSHTASAGESFAYTLQQYGRAKVIGETTAGAGYNNAVIPLGQGFVFSISYGRPEHPVSHRGWEAVGVQPDVKISADRALETAREIAAKNLAGKAPSGNAGSEARKLERAWLDAYEQNDASAMEKILADEFVITYPDGRTENKAQVIETVKKMKGRNPDAPSKFSTQDVQTRTEGDRVILSGIVTQQSERAGAAVTTRSSYTDAYLRRDGRWQVLSSHLRDP